METSQGRKLIVREMTKLILVTSNRLVRKRCFSSNKLIRLIQNLQRKTSLKLALDKEI